MKSIITVLMSSFLFISTIAQTVTLSFRGNEQSKNYRVLVDGTSFYSNNAVNTNDNNGVGGQRTITLSNLSPGSHSLSVYSNTNAAANSKGSLIYSNNFQLRSDYDMTISITGNRISFSEKIAEMNDDDLGITPMAANDFAELLQEIKSNRYQSARVAVIREALGSSDHFTTNQVRQLLTLVTAENTRLELAKLSYAMVTDQNNFARVNTLFTSQANRNSLTNYVQLQANTSVTVPVAGSNVRALLSNAQYDQLLVNLNNTNYQSGKFTIIKDALGNNNNLFTIAQLRQLLSTVTSEPDRLYLAKQAYANAYDATNFATLLTLFTTQANRAELNSYIVSNGGTGGNVYVQTRIPMTDANFRELLKNAGNHILPWDKIKDVKAAFSDPQNNFTSAQARQMLYLVSSGNLLSVSESSRLELAKLSYARITDPENFNQIFDLFPMQSSKDELNSYIKLQVQNN